MAGKTMSPQWLTSMLFRRLRATRFWKDNYLVLREFRHFSKVIFLALLFASLSATFEGVSLGFLLSFLQSLTDDSALAKTGITWVDTFILATHIPAQQRVYRISVLVIVSTLLRSAFQYLTVVYVGKSQHRFAYQLRLRIFEQLQRLPLGYFATTHSGELVNTITSEIKDAMRAFASISTLVIAAITLLVYVASMIIISWQLTILSILLFGCLSVGVTSLFSRVRKASFNRSKASSRYVSVSMEFISGIRTVRTFTAENFERKRFNKANKTFLQAATKTVSILGLIGPIIEAAAAVVIVMMLLFSFTVLIPAGQLQLASLLTFMFVLLRIMPLVKQINSKTADINNFYGAFNKITNIIRTDNKHYLTNGSQQFDSLEQAIRLDSVCFEYDKTPVLHDINLTIEKGTTIALVGASGSGKSTLVDLISRFYDPTYGQILVDSTDLRALDIGSFRQKVAIVSQDSFIFHDTVRSNIAYSLGEAVSDSEVWEAARRANAFDFIQSMPEGLDTLLGDRGMKLSGGQRQRIAIARALIRDPEILILDEATSALDSVSEKLIQESIERLIKGRTVIVIAHRLSTVVNADRIVVLENGHIIEQGTYQALLEQQGMFWKYYTAQNKNS